MELVPRNIVSEVFPLLALLAACSWLLWQRYGPGIADRRALRTVRTKMHRMAAIALAELQPTYSDIARRVQRVVTLVPATQRHQVRVALENMYRDLFSVLIADRTPEPITDHTRNRLAEIDRRLRETELLVLLADD
jgi:hypothetical protein